MEIEKQTANSRVLKFRAWDKEKKEFYYSEEGSGGWWGDCIIDNEKYKGLIQQFTGLLDRHGKDIYEGDVVKYQINGHKEITDELLGKVEFDCFYLTFTTLGGKEGCGDNCEIIGNIYENPELVNKK